MSLLSAQNVTHGPVADPLFEGLSLTLADGDRVGLVGRNGCGKSTLLSILAGRAEPQEGRIVRRGGLKLAEVEQFLPPEAAGRGLIDYVAGALPAERRALERHRAEIALGEVGFGPDRYGQDVASLSGGELNRAMLARALVDDPDLLILDEPTNHLDLATQAFFEEFLTARTRCAFVVVSHDRAFLDATTNRTVFLRDRRAWRFELPYSAARAQLLEMDAAAAAARQAEEKEIARLRRAAKRLAIWGRTYDNEGLSARAKAIEKRAERKARETTFVSTERSGALSLDAAGAQAKRLLHAEGLAVAHEGTGAPLLQVERLSLRPGDRLALFGANGAGKSTLLRRIARAAADPDAHAPALRFNPQARLGWYDQTLSRFAPDATLFEAVHPYARMPDQALRRELIDAGFSYARQDQKVGRLSGGERARLLFLALKLERPNLLILDEPTNHIDIDGREALEAEILDQDATLILVSHDRRFVDAVCNRWAVIRRGRLEELDDAESYYVELRAFEGGAAPAAKAKPAVAPTVPQGDEEALLAELLELETKLAADLARKPAHQKPALQKQWRARIAALYARLPS